MATIHAANPHNRAGPAFFRFRSPESRRHKLQLILANLAPLFACAEHTILYCGEPASDARAHQGIDSYRWANPVNDMSDRDADCVRFVPSRIYGEYGDRLEVVVFSDRLEVHGHGSIVKYKLSDIARRQESVLVACFKRLFGIRPYQRIVGYRDWFHEPPNRYFIFYTDPPITICMPVDEPEDHQSSYFFRIQQILLRGGYGTYDLG